MCESTTQKGGAPEGNVNAAKHGGYSQKRFASISTPPKEYKAIYERVAGWRKVLEREITRRRGEAGLSKFDECLIASACDWEMTRQIAMKHQRDRGTYSPEAFEKGMKVHNEAREKVIQKLKALGLDDGSVDEDPWEGEIGEDGQDE